MRAEVFCNHKDTLTEDLESLEVLQSKIPHPREQPTWIYLRNPHKNTKSQTTFRCLVNQKEQSNLQKKMTKIKTHTPIGCLPPVASAGKRLGISPVFSRLLTSSTKPSSWRCVHPGRSDPKNQKSEHCQAVLEALYTVCFFNYFLCKPKASFAIGAI